MPLVYIYFLLYVSSVVCDFLNQYHPLCFNSVVIFFFGGGELSSWFFNLLTLQCERQTENILTKYAKLSLFEKIYFFLQQLGVGEFFFLFISLGSEFADKCT